MSTQVRELPCDLQVETVEFVQPCPPRYRCQSCDVVNGNILRARCGHGFCPPCADTAPKQCPVDGKALQTAELTKEEEVGDVLKLKVFCPNRRHGCKRSTVLQDLQGHLRSCGYLPMMCPCECGLEVSRRELAKHLAELCDRRLLPCQCCEEEIPFRDKEDHLDVCPKKPVICIFCKDEVTRDQLPDHEEKCPHRPRKCHLFDLGCRFKGNNNDLESHEEDVKTHMEVMATSVITCKQGLEKLSNQVTALTDQISQLRLEIQKTHGNGVSFKQLQTAVVQLQENVKTIQESMDGKKKLSRGLFTPQTESGRNSPLRHTAPPTPL